MSDKPKQQPLSFIAPIKGVDESSIQANYEALRTLLTQVTPDGLNKVGTVHFGNFIFLEPVTGTNGEYYKKFALFTFYDGEFRTYVKDFVVNVGDTFNALLTYLDDVPEGVIPVQRNIQAFGDYVEKYDQPVAKWYAAYPNKIVKDITDPVEGVVIP